LKKKKKKKSDVQHTSELGARKIVMQYFNFKLVRCYEFAEIVSLRYWG